MPVKTTYAPTPIDTDDIPFPADLTVLLEQLAENTHDVWAALRIKQGWKYGPARNDDRKEHPGLVPYAELSEDEKDYDRATARETLKAILKLGYRVAK
jgi:hypothetical protein